MPPVNLPWNQPSTPLILANGGSDDAVDVAVTNGIGDLFMHRVKHANYPQMLDAAIDHALGCMLIIAFAVGLWVFLRKLITRFVAANIARTAGSPDPRRESRLKTLGSVGKSLVSCVIMGWAVLAVFSEFGVDVRPLIASAGIVGAALGLGAQSLVKDFLTGMFMLIEDQYGVGDVIDTGRFTGTVEAVGLRTTEIRDSEGTLWYIRNGRIKHVGNENRSFRTVHVSVEVLNQELAGLAKRLLPDAASPQPSQILAAFGDALAHAAHDDHPWVLTQPSFDGVVAHGAQSTTISVTATVKPGHRRAITTAISSAAENLLDRPLPAAQETAKPASDAASGAASSPSNNASLKD